MNERSWENFRLQIIFQEIVLSTAIQLEVRKVYNSLKCRRKLDTNNVICSS